MKCAHCDGDLDQDGYCTLCGLKAVAAPAAPAMPEPSFPSAATAAPRQPGTSPRTGTRRSGTTRATRTSGVTGTGGRAGRRVELPPPEIKEPTEVLLEHPSIPENKRFCGNPECNSPVGRSRNGQPGRPEGFCPKCQHPFSFSPKLAPTTLVGGQYEVAGCIAHGGLGWIYLARDQKVSQRWVVLKGLLRTDDIDVIRGELQFLAAVDHPNIVKVHNFVEHDLDPYIVMEYVHGATLRKTLEDRREANNGDPDPLPVTHAITFMLEVLPAFAYLHGLGLLFCDFKPDNVIRTDSSLKLIDLGAVYRMGDTTSAIYGTPGYQAPEIGDTGPTVPSDLYTVGRTLAVLCTDGRGYQSTYSRSLPTPNDVPLFAEYDSCYRFLVRATAADPDDRFQSAEEMADQLTGVLHEIVASESGVPWPEPSSTFTGELRTNLSDPGDWRALPTPLLATDDAAAAFLASLGVAVSEPDEILALLQQAPERTVEVQLREARTLIEAGRYDDADGILTEIALADPWEWRVAWTTGLNALAQSDFDRALREFRGVYASLPGELAPKLAMAYAAESSGDLQSAEHWYDIVSTTDPSFTGAVFGLARCRSGIGDVAGAIAAYERVPSTSSTYVDAQVARTRLMLDPEARDLTVDDVVAAGRVVDDLTLPKEIQARLTADVLAAALELVQHTNGTAPDPDAVAPMVLGCPLTEVGVRLGLELTYRRLALQSPAGAERIALVDRANELRPRTML
jgi:serine/threonine-protein kinase PknG